MAMNKMGTHNAVKAPIKKATHLPPKAASRKVAPKSAPAKGLKGTR